MEKLAGIIGMICIGSVLFFGLSVLLAIPMFFLWNWLMPEIFGLPLITFWQAFGLNLLSGILFKSVSTNNKK